MVGKGGRPDQGKSNILSLVVAYKTDLVKQGYIIPLIKQTARCMYSKLSFQFKFDTLEQYIWHKLVYINSVWYCFMWDQRLQMKYLCKVLPILKLLLWVLTSARACIVPKLFCSNLKRKCKNYGLPVIRNVLAVFHTISSTLLGEFRIVLRLYAELVRCLRASTVLEFTCELSIFYLHPYRILHANVNTFFKPFTNWKYFSTQQVLLIVVLIE